MNNRINNVKFIAAIFVITTHLNVAFVNGTDFEMFNVFFRYIGRFAVPYFLIISGYFWMEKHKSETIKKMLMLQFIFTILVAIEEAVFSGIFENYRQIFSIHWYLPTVSLIMLVALFVKKENYIYLFIATFMIANGIIIFNLEISHESYILFFDFLRYGYMFYFGYILKLLMNNPKFANNISKFSYIFLASTIAFQIFNALNNGYNYNQTSLVQFLFTVPLVLFAIVPNNDKAFKYNKYSLDMFLYHILIVSLFAYFNSTYILITVTDVKYLTCIYIIEVLITVPLSIMFGKLLRYIDNKYLQLIY